MFMLSLYEIVDNIRCTVIAYKVATGNVVLTCKEARNSFHFPQTSFTNSFPNTVWFIASV